MNQITQLYRTPNVVHQYIQCPTESTIHTLNYLWLSRFKVHYLGSTQLVDLQTSSLSMRRFDVKFEGGIISTELDKRTCYFLLC